MTDLEAIEYTLRTGKSVPPTGCAHCHYYFNKYKYHCGLFQSKEEIRRCVQNDFKAGMRSIYLKSK